MIWLAGFEAFTWMATTQVSKVLPEIVKNVRWVRMIEQSCFVRILEQAVVDRGGALIRPRTMALVGISPIAKDRVMKPELTSLVNSASSTSHRPPAGSWLSSPLLSPPYMSSRSEVKITSLPLSSEELHDRRTMVHVDRCGIANLTTTSGSMVRVDSRTDLEL